MTTVKVFKTHRHEGKRNGQPRGCPFRLPSCICFLFREVPVGCRDTTVVNGLFHNTAGVGETRDGLALLR